MIAISEEKLKEIKLIYEASWCHLTKRYLMELQDITAKILGLEIEVDEIKDIIYWL